ncbi:nuclear transport factor 2 family protein [Galbibacter sp. EGI 63066]|uniref:YybH family protein n=1 Tax=Galbibacter sp. EGI 63066 TaxID=2993559 RepID=UPI002248F7C2|nr:nuclear transport factor 2 family protein [Galbibacter sp. EGI 63066]MCX2678880.1 nuclear transport factor 2 family protein [Galbibacter sp. EGI 63066]
MKPFFLAVFLLLNINLSFAQEQISPADRSAILKVFNEQESAWNRGDIPAFMEGYWKSEDLAFVGSSGAVFGWEATKERYLKGYPDTTAMGKLTFKVIKLQQVKEGVAQIIGSFHLKRSIGDLNGYFTLIWRKFDDKWLIISDHTSATN